MATVRQTQADFLQRAYHVHKDRYSYSKTVYEYAKKAVVITCRKHGDFVQTPKKHYEGQGCPACRQQRHSLLMTGVNSVDEREFLRRARAKFGTAYTYRGYVSLSTPFVVVCKTHGEYTTTPKHHLALTCGCPECGRNRKTTEEFIKLARRIHGDWYEYDETDCSTTERPVTIKCPTHGVFRVSQRKHLAGHGCRECGLAAHAANRVADAGKKFIAEARKVHGDAYVYDSVTYGGRHRKVAITCPTHGVFWQTAGNHLNGQGCPACSLSSKLCTPSTFVAEARKIHGDQYDYSDFSYTMLTAKSTIRCKIHGDFQMSPNNHLRGAGCKQCSTSGYSKIAIKWIEEKARSMRLKNVMHAMNGGEYRIPGTRLSVDGYHARTNTVFEFYGDCYHGNLKVYAKDSTPNPYSTLTANQLFRKTMRREELLRSLGYRVISIWEKDYRASCR